MRIYLIIICILLGACEHVDHLALAQACGNGPECQELWDEWNKHEERVLFKEKLDAFKRQCPEETYLICIGHNEDVRCVKHPQRQCRCYCGTFDYSELF